MGLETCKACSILYFLTLFFDLVLLS